MNPTTECLMGQPGDTCRHEFCQPCSAAEFSGIFNDSDQGKRLYHELVQGLAAMKIECKQLKRALFIEEQNRNQLAILGHENTTLRDELAELRAKRRGCLNSVVEASLAFPNVGAHIAQLEARIKSLESDVFCIPPCGENDYEGFKWCDSHDDLEKKLAAVLGVVERMKEALRSSEPKQFPVKERTNVVPMQDRLLWNWAQPDGDQDQLENIRADIRATMIKLDKAEKELEQIRTTLQNGLDRDKDDTPTSALAVIAINALARARSS